MIDGQMSQAFEGVWVSRCRAQFKSRMGKDLRISYPCVVLNVMVAQHNTNEQYQTLVDAQALRYETSSRMSIEFEVDGPYKVLPHWCGLLFCCWRTVNPAGTRSSQRVMPRMRRTSVRPSLPWDGRENQIQLEANLHQDNQQCALISLSEGGRGRHRTIAWKRGALHPCGDLL